MNNISRRGGSASGASEHRSGTPKRPQNSVTAASYRNGKDIKEELTGQTHRADRSTYSLRIVNSFIMAPANTPKELLTPQGLWNAVEKSEKRKDAWLARDHHIALPFEWKQELREEVIRDFVRQQFTDKGMIAEVSFHKFGSSRWAGKGNTDAEMAELRAQGVPFYERDAEPKDATSPYVLTIRRPNGQPKEYYVFQPHVHIMRANRYVNENGLSDRKIRCPSGDNNVKWERRQLIELRQAWADHANRHLAPDNQMSPLSLKEQGIAREPQVNMGPKAVKLERNGEKTPVGDEVREIKQRNATRDALKVEIAAATAEVIHLEAERHKRTRRMSDYDDLNNLHARKEWQPENYRAAISNAFDYALRYKNGAEHGSQDAAAFDRWCKVALDLQKEGVGRFGMEWLTEREQKGYEATQNFERQEREQQATSSQQASVKPQDERIADAAFELKLNEERARATLQNEAEAQIKRAESFKTDAQREAERAAKEREQHIDAEKRRVDEGKISSADSRWAIAQKGYDIRDPYGSLARAAMTEGAMFRKQHDELNERIALAQTDRDRTELTYRRDIQYYEYYARTERGIAHINEVIGGKGHSQSAILGHAKADDYEAQVKALREQRHEFLKAPEREENRKMAENFSELRQALDKGKFREDKPKEAEKPKETEAAKLKEPVKEGVRTEQHEAVRGAEKPKQPVAEKPRETDAAKRPVRAKEQSPVEREIAELQRGWDENDRADAAKRRAPEPEKTAQADGRNQRETVEVKRAPERVTKPKDRDHVKINPIEKEIAELEKGWAENDKADAAMQREVGRSKGGMSR